MTLHRRTSSFLGLALLFAGVLIAPPLWAQAGGGSAIAWLYCYTGSGAITSSGSYAPCSASNPIPVTGPLAVTIADGADVAEGAKADTAYAGSGSASIIAILKGLYNGITSAIPAGSNVIGKVGIDQTTPGTTNAVSQSGPWTVQPGNTPNTTPWLANPTSQYPSGATPLTASATGTTGATTATLAGTSGKTTYICGYSIRANATAAATVTNTITGVITATLSSVMWVAPLASGIGIDEQIFSPCIPASATNTGIAIVSGAPGSGGTVSSKGWGYQL